MRAPLAIALAAGAAFMGASCGGITDDIGKTDQAVTGIEGSIEYGLDAPWRMEPRGTAPNYTYDEIPIQVSFFDEGMTPRQHRYQKICSVEVAHINGSGDVMNATSYLPSDFTQIETTRKGALASLFADNTTSVDLTRGYWERYGLPPWRGFCRPKDGDYCATTFNKIYDSTEWHGLIKHQPVAPPVGGNQLYRLRAFVAPRDQGCDDGWAIIRFENWVNVHFARDPLPRFGDNWLYGDLHYHSQGTDNEGEVGYNYRGTVQAMSAIGLDFAFATEHASNSQQIADVRLQFDSGYGLDWTVQDEGSVVQGLRDMNATRFADHTALLQRIATNGFDLPSLRNGLRPWIFLGGELDVQPELSKVPAGTPVGVWNFVRADGRNFNLLKLCDSDVPDWLTPDCEPWKLVTAAADGAIMISDRQGIDDYPGSRQHLVYLPEAPNPNSFVPSNTSKFGGGTRRLTHVHNGQMSLTDEVKLRKGIVFLAHPLSGGGGGNGPGSIPWTNHSLKQAFSRKVVAGLQFWNENGRLKSEPDEHGYSITVLKNPSDELGFEDRRFHLRPMADEYDLYKWRFDELTNNAESQLHNGGIVWDKMLLWGLDPVRAGQLSWINDPDKPRKVFAAAGSDAHGDFNYRREGKAIETTGISDTALGKVRNLVDVGSLTQDSAVMQTRTQTAIANGRFSMTDGPAIRIAIDNNDNNVIDAGDTMMGDVMHLPADRKLRVLVEWKSTAEFGPPDVVDLYVGAFKSGPVACSDDNCPRARTFAPVNHGVRTLDDRPGILVDPSQDSSQPRLMQDGYFRPEYSGARLLRFNVSNPVGEDGQMYWRSQDLMSGRVTRVLPMDSFSVGTGAADRFYVRAFIRTKSVDINCNVGTAAARRNHALLGKCLSRYGMSNPVWAVKPQAGPPWTQKAASSTYHDIRHTTTDDEGNVYIASQFTGTVTIGNRSLTSVGSQDAYVGKFDRTGNLVWLRHISGSGSTSAEGLTVDNKGRVAIVGDVSGTMTIGNHNHYGNGYDGYVATFLAESGHTLWLSNIGGSTNQHGRALAYAPNGTLYIAGEYQGTVGAGWWTQPSNGGFDCFLAAFATSGSLSWVRNVGGGTGNCRATGVATNAQNQAIMSGHYDGQIVVDRWSNFSETTHVAGSTADGFIAAFDSDLQYAWHTLLSTPSSRSIPYGIATDAQGRIYIAGAFTGLLYIDDGESASPVAVAYAGSSYQAYVLELNDDGTYDTSNIRVYGGTGHDYAYSIDVTKDGRYCVAGRFYSSTMYVAGDTLNKYGAFNGFVLGFNADNSLAFTDAIARSGGTASTGACSIAEDGTVAASSKFHYRARMDGDTDIYSTGGGWDGLVGVYRSHLD